MWMPIELVRERSSTEGLFEMTKKVRKSLYKFCLNDPGLSLIMGCCSLGIAGCLAYGIVFGPKAELERKEIERATQIEDELIRQCQLRAAGLDKILSEDESRKLAAAFGVYTTWREKAEIARSGFIYDYKPSILLYVGIKNSNGVETPYKSIPVNKKQMEDYLRGVEK